MDSMAMTSRKTGLQKDTLKRIFNKLMRHKTDSLWIDLTDDSRAKLRKNGYEIIEKSKRRKHKFDNYNDSDYSNSDE